MKALIQQLEQHYHQPARCAEAQALIYFLEDTPGFRRKKWGRGFRYFDPSGTPVKAPPLKKRLSSIPAPPAWRNVWLAPEDNFHVLAYGEDTAGRKQYTYHPRWSAYRNRLKYYHLLTFSEVLAPLRKAAYAQLKHSEKAAPDHAEQMMALMVLLLDKGALRIGSEYYYEQRETVGLTTLHPEHVQCKGPQIELCYPAKSGQERCIHIQHKRLSQAIQHLKASVPEGNYLFSYVHDPDGERHAISAEQLNQYLNRFSDFAVSAKDFRTWKGTLKAFETMVKAYQKGEQRSLKAISEVVAKTLGNTPAIAQQSYIHGDLLSLWQEGRFGDYYTQVEHKTRKAYFSTTEVQLSALLEILFQEKMLPLL